jgi:hypothetical protein
MSKRSASGAQLAHALSASHCLFTDWRPTARFRHRRFCHSLSWSALMEAANQDQQHAAVRTSLIFVQVLSPSAASCADRGVLERAQHRPLQSANRQRRTAFLTVGQNTFNDHPIEIVAQDFTSLQCHCKSSIPNRSYHAMAASTSLSQYSAIFRI